MNLLKKENHFFLFDTVKADSAVFDCSVFLLQLQVTKYLYNLSNQKFKFTPVIIVLILKVVLWYFNAE